MRWSRTASSRATYLLATAHRAGNVDDPVRLRLLVDVLLALPLPVVLPLHPRTRARLEAAGWLAELTGAAHVRLAPPLGYLDFTALLCNALAVVTDSGGVQKEAYLAGVPCVTLRPSTEWVETLESGWNTLVDLDADAALAALERALPAERPPAVRRWLRRRAGGGGRACACCGRSGCGLSGLAGGS